MKHLITLAILCLISCGGFEEVAPTTHDFHNVTKATSCDGGATWMVEEVRLRRDIKGCISNVERLLSLYDRDAVFVWEGKEYRAEELIYCK